MTQDNKVEIVTLSGPDKKPLLRAEIAGEDLGYPVITSSSTDQGTEWVSIATGIQGINQNCVVVEYGEELDNMILKLQSLKAHHDAK